MGSIGEAGEEEEEDATGFSGGRPSLSNVDSVTPSAPSVANPISAGLSNPMAAAETEERPASKWSTIRSSRLNNKVMLSSQESSKTLGSTRNMQQEAISTMTASELRNMKPGEIHFPTEMRSCIGTAKFLKVKIAKDAEAAHLKAQANSIHRFMCRTRDGWNLPHPELIISVTGQATQMELRRSYHDIFTHGLVMVAKQTNAWIVDGGMDAGVMKLMGETKAKHYIDTPVIGFATWDCIHGREQIERGEEYTASRVGWQKRFNAKEGAVLDANHSHFILMEPEQAAAPGGAGGAQLSDGEKAPIGRVLPPPWGCEIKLRSQMEKHLSLYSENEPFGTLTVQALRAAGLRHTGSPFDTNDPYVVLRVCQVSRPKTSGGGGGGGGDSGSDRKSHLGNHSTTLTRYTFESPVCYNAGQAPDWTAQFASHQVHASTRHAPDRAGGTALPF
jgi:hypothetical protein